MQLFSIWSICILVLYQSTDISEAFMLRDVAPDSDAEVDAMPIKDVAQKLHDNAVAGIQKLLFRSGPTFSGVAGMHQFAETWSRDLSHASIGLLAKPTWEIDGELVNSLTIVKDIALNFLAKVTPNMTLAPRVLDSLHSGAIVDKENKLKLKVIKGSIALDADYTFGRDINQHPDFPEYPFVSYYQGESGAPTTIDSNYWVLHGFARYAANAPSTEVAQVLSQRSSGNFSVADKLRLTLGYYAADDHWDTIHGKPFLSQTEYAEWKDSIKQVGASSFTNLQFIETLEALFEVPAVSIALEGTKLHWPRFGIAFYDHSHQRAMQEVMTQWKRDILEVFMLHDGLLQESWSVPNMSHVDGHLHWLRVATEPEFKGAVSFDNIVANFVTRNSDGKITNLPGTPTGIEWPSTEIAPEKRLIGLGYYHGSLAWSWLVGLFAYVAHVHQRFDLRDDILRWLLKAHHSAPKGGFADYISEVYCQGRILVGPPYTSETPFMWGSTYVLWATTTILADLPDTGLIV